MINEKLLRKYIKAITSFFPKLRQDDIRTLWVEAIIDPSFIAYYQKWIKKCASSKSIETLEQCFKNKFDYLIKAFTKPESESKNNKIERLQHAFLHFIMLESFVEENIFIHKVLNNIKIKNPKDYLKIIADADERQKSCKSLVESLQVTIPNIYPKEIRFYLIFKKWQDITHFFFVETAIRDNEYLEEQLLGNGVVDNVYINNMTMADIRLKNYLKTKVISLNEMSLLLELGFDKVVKDIYGGKSYGLAVLKKLGCVVPNAFVVPTDCGDLENLKYIKKNKRYAVRSSANIEDGTSKSFAGMFCSFLDVMATDVKDKIGLVRDSAKSARVKTYLDRNNLKTDIHMAVIVQEFEKPSFAGVWFGTNTNEGILEYVDGDGEKLVSGHQTPTQELWNKKEPNNALSSKNGPIGALLLKLQNDIINQYNVLPDIEWCIVNNQLRFVQFRPITTKMITPLTDKSINMTYDSFVGTPCSAGEVTAICQLLEYSEQQDEFKDKNILLAMYTDPDWLPAIEKSSGVATAIGGFLCHTAIICRELGIPCVVGAGMDYLEKVNNKRISLNGTTGEIHIGKNQ